MLKKRIMEIADAKRTAATAAERRAKAAPCMETVNRLAIFRSFRRKAASKLNHILYMRRVVVKHFFAGRRIFFYFYAQEGAQTGKGRGFPCAKKGVIIRKRRRRRQISSIGRTDMAELTLKRAKEIIQRHVSEKHLLLHALAVSAAMGAMAEQFGEDAAHWEAIGYLHDVDFEKYPEEHLSHVRELLDGEGIEESDIRAILSHGYGLCSDVEPKTNLEKSLFTVDELTGIVMAAALMRPTGIEDLEVKSVMKKFKDKRFAAKCDRDLILRGCVMLGLPIETVAERVIAGMRRHMEELGLGPKEAF